MIHNIRATYPVIVTGVFFLCALHITTEEAFTDFQVLFGYKTQSLCFPYQFSGGSNAFIVAPVGLIL